MINENKQSAQEEVLHWRNSPINDQNVMNISRDLEIRDLDNML